MRPRCRLYRRNGIYYLHDHLTGKQVSLGTRNRQDALRLFAAKNEAHQQPVLNLQLARIYLSATDPEIASRTWQGVMEAITKLKRNETQTRWARAQKDAAFVLIHNLRLLETRSEHFLQVLGKGTVATNVFLRRMHNFALDMGWLPVPVIVRRHWPRVEYKPRRAITVEEHARIVEREHNPERQAFYKLCWHLGGSQGDLANLLAEDVDWANGVVSYRRAKTGSVALLHFGEQVAGILRQLPGKGPVFPYLATVRACDRATEFKQRCQGLGINGVTLHSYRYAWAERAKAAGYPERFAQEALGHNSKAVHRAYARQAKVTVPSLEDYESQQAQNNVIRFPFKAVTPEPSVASAAGQP